MPQSTMFPVTNELAKHPNHTPINYTIFLKKMCYKKQTYYKSCSHTRTEEEDCPHQKRLSQLRLQERLDAHRRQRSSWLLCIFCFLIAPEPRTRTPEPRRECPLQDVRVEVDGRCPQCRLLDAQAAAVGRRDRYEYDYAARRCRVRGEVRGSEMNAVADLDPSRPTQTQHLKSPESTCSGRPAPLRVSKTKQNQKLSKSKRSYSRKPGRSAVAALENPPLSAVMEDVEKAWNDACTDGGSAARTARKPSQELPPLTSPSSYSPELPIEDLIDEVELLWRRAGCSNDGPG
ncbi:hypothetical protein GCG54_00004065 [Colletotrichum gloeosporioides]|uniref:Uncharacterized protein n=1 Tax=Colletotrichum gloeosporioides TaxID=474922 RepID=A0A8H4CJ85_COLGL|nr:uncharacterized protein GCG54_00004065 [Colletotrichum gloeosporioides]KAF3804796.1 hypothetical protein GCG54_00004065 [Colletotrichum gloeosporioides]